MVIAALLAFAILLIAWIFAPGGTSAERMPVIEPEVLPAAA